MRRAFTRLPEADLHCHTTASDGLYSPRELVQRAYEIGLRVVGITDHDTIKGWEEAIQAGMEYGVEILRGIELNTEWNGREVHILGYEFDEDLPYLRERLEKLLEARRQRMQEILKRLARLGVYISVEDVQKFAQGESIGRPHIAQALVEHGFAGSIREAFDKYIGLGAPAYVPRFKLSPEEGIKLIRESGGVAVLAHPGTYGLDKFIPDWVQIGLQGVEVSHPEHSPEDEQRCRAVAEKFNLIMTGGSDFHGELRKPGIDLGGWGTSMEVVERIRELVRSQKF